MVSLPDLQTCLKAMKHILSTSRCHNTTYSCTRHCSHIHLHIVNMTYIRRDLSQNAARVTTPTYSSLHLTQHFPFACSQHGSHLSGLLQFTTSMSARTMRDAIYWSFRSHIEQQNHSQQNTNRCACLCSSTELFGSCGNRGYLSLDENFRRHDCTSTLPSTTDTDME
jgi:hypothetical protein